MPGDKSLCDPKPQQKVTFKLEVDGDMHTAFDGVSKLVGLIVDCQNEGLALRVEFYGARKPREEK